MKRSLLCLCAVVFAGCPAPSSNDAGAGGGTATGGGSAYDSGFVSALPPGMNGQGYAIAASGMNAFVVGNAWVDGGSPALLVAKFKPDRTLDTTWAANGIALVDVPDGVSGGLTSFSSDSAYVAMVDGDQLYVGGTALALMVPGGGQKTLLARFLANGSLDTTFGNTGAMTGIRLDGFNGVNSTECQALLKQPDGKILIGGEVQGNFFVTRYLTSGTADITFSKTPGTGFGAVWGTSRDEATRSMVLDPDGKIVVFGGDSMSGARLLSDGQLDLTFGTSGYISSPGAEGAALWRETDGSYLAVGFAALKTDAGDNQLGIRFLKLTSAGAPDLTFGAGGYRQVVLPGTNLGLSTIRGSTRLADGSFVFYVTGLGLTYLVHFDAAFAIAPDSLENGALKPTSIKLPLFQPAAIVGQHLGVTEGNRVWVTDITNVVIEPKAPTTKNFFEVINQSF